MTVQFILPEATSFHLERKLHDRLFLVLLYNLLCKTFKDHSSASAASSLSERNPLLQERCFPIASAKVEHSCIPCKRSPKKNARNFHLRPFCHFIALQNRQQSPFFRRYPTPPFSLQNLRFSRFSPFRTRFRAIFREIALVFRPAKPTFFSSFLVLEPTSDDFSGNLSHFSLRTPLFALHEGFFISCSLILHALHHLHLPISAPHSPRPSPPSPTFFLIPPHFSIFLPNKRTIARTLAHYARTRTPAHTYTSGGFRL